MYIYCTPGSVGHSTVSKCQLIIYSLTKCHGLFLTLVTTKLCTLRHIKEGYRLFNALISML